MNKEQFISLLKTVLKVMGTLIAAHGSTKLDPSTWEAISGAVLLLAPVGFDMYSKTLAAQKERVAAMPNTLVISTVAPVPIEVANKIAAMPDVAEVVSTQHVAEATPSPKIVAMATTPGA